MAWQHLLAAKNSTKFDVFTVVIKPRRMAESRVNNHDEHQVHDNRPAGTRRGGEEDPGSGATPGKA